MEIVLKRAYGGPTFTLGCIIVGERRRPYEGYVYDSRKTENRLMDILTKLPKNEEIWITIE